MNIYNSVTELIGSTPLLKLYGSEETGGAAIYGKMECFNPAGSVKDRVALAMIADAEKRGFLRTGSVIIEPTSGNTGIGLCAVAAAKGYRTIIVMPDTMSVERRRLMAAYGGEIILTPGAEGMKGAIAKAEELRESIPGSFIPGQFTNPVNPAAHRASTGPEIWRDTEGTVDIFVAGVGSGGTVTGAGSYLKAKNPRIKVIAVEPADSPVLSGGAAAPHKIQGIGAGFIPEILDISVCDEIIALSADDAYAECRALCRTKGIFVGISSGAAVRAARSVAQRPENTGKQIVALLPDSGERYLSLSVFD